jgi:hypothetical protein
MTMLLSFRHAILTVALATTAALASTPAAAQTGNGCKPLDSYGQAFLDWAKLTATGTDSAQIKSRANLQIPKVVASKVTYVLSGTDCQKAVTAYSTAAGVSPTGRSVYLVKIGTIYVIKDPTVLAGEWWFSVTADNKFKVLVKFTG